MAMDFMPLLVLILAITSVPPLMMMVGPQFHSLIVAAFMLVIVFLLNYTGVLGEADSRKMSLEELLREAQTQLEQKNWNKLGRVSQMAMEKNPACPRAWELLVTALKREGRDDEALTMVTKAREDYDVDSRALAELQYELQWTLEELLRHAEMSLAQNNWVRVQELATKATKKEPQNARAWELLATAYKWDGDREQAAATAKKAQELYEVESECLAELARDLEEKKRPGELAAEFEKKGEEFFARRQFDLAVEDFREALKIVGEPDDICPESILVTGPVAVQQKRLGEFNKLVLEAEAEQAGRPIYQNSNDQYLFFWKPAGCWRIGPSYTDGAAGIKSAGLEPDPLDPTRCSAWKVHNEGAWNLESKLRVTRGETTAEEDADASLRLRLLRRRAECAQQLQDWSTVCADMTTVISQDSDDLWAYLLRAAANEALEKFKEALEDARKVLAFDPKNAAANRIASMSQQAIDD